MSVKENIRDEMALVGRDGDMEILAALHDVDLFG